MTTIDKDELQRYLARDLTNQEMEVDDPTSYIHTAIEVIGRRVPTEPGFRQDFRDAATANLFDWLGDYSVAFPSHGGEPKCSLGPACRACNG